MPRYRAFQHLEEFLVSNLPYRVHSISLEKAQPGRELWHGGDSWLHDDKVAEWLRRWTANPMCSARVGSNPILVDIFAHTWVREAKKIYQQPSKGESGKCHVQNTKKGFPTPGIEPGPPG